MNVDSSVEIPTGDKTFTRRDFLKRAAAYLAVLLGLGGKIATEGVTAAVQEHPEETFADAVVLAMSEMGTERGNLYLKLAAKAADIKTRQVILEDPRLINHQEERMALVKPNPDLRNPVEILKEAIEMYEDETGKKPIWRALIPPNDQLEAKSLLVDVRESVQEQCTPRSSHWFPGAELLENLCFATESAFTNAISKMSNKRYRFLTEALIRESKANFNGFDEHFGNFFPASGILLEAYRRSGIKEQYWQTRWNLIPENEKDKVLACLANVLPSVYGEVDFSVFEETPVSVSRLLNFFLKRNSGDLSLSLWDTTLFLKLLCRNDFTTGLFAAYNSESIPDLVQRTSNFLDEYSLSGNWHILRDLSKREVLEYEDHNLELSAINQIGLIYHIWNINALLTILPPDVCRLISAAKIMRGWRYTSQGYKKSAAELAATADLGKLNKVLQEHREGSN